MSGVEENINEQRVIVAPLEIEELELLTSIEVQGEATGAGITIQQNQPNHVNPEASPTCEGENRTQEVSGAAIILMVGVCIIQTGAAGVAACLQGSSGNQTSQNHRLFLGSNIILMCVTYLFAICIAGLYLFGRKIPNFSVIVKIMIIGAVGSLTLAVVLGIIFYFSSN